MNKNLFVYFITAIFLFSSCQKSPYKKLLIGSWQLVNFTTNENTTKDANYVQVAKNLILTTSMDLNSDGTITSYIWGQRLDGHWKVKGDKLIVTAKQEKKPFVAKIVKLTDKQLLIYSSQGKVKVLLYFRRDLL